MPSDHTTWARAYTNDAGQDVYWIGTDHKHTTPLTARKRLLVIHHSAGEDSRAYLKRNERGVSAHYLVREEAQPIGLRVYKYASEIRETTYTQGFGVLGGDDVSAINDACVSMEIEGPPFTVALIDYAARLARSILRGWAQRGLPLIMVTHEILDSRKDDPALNWQRWCENVYQ